jgi:hypothetical protein
MTTSVQIIAVEQQQSSDCTQVVLAIQYRRNQFKVLIHLRPQVDHHGSLPEACRSELRELFDGLLDWEIADGTVTDVGTRQSVAAP